ncbi:hypothetical protein M3O75_10635 [Klebsiella pneumoniae]|nr:hypothetical protein [Klebsiella pneumoniae]
MHSSNVSTHGMAVAPTTSPVRARWRSCARAAAPLKRWWLPRRPSPSSIPI